MNLSYLCGITQNQHSTKKKVEEKMHADLSFPPNLYRRELVV